MRDRCDNDNGCQELPYSICREKKCVCDHKHVQKDKRCKAILKGGCKSNSDCGVDHSICDRNQSVCECEQNYYARPDNRQCIKFAESKNILFIVMADVDHKKLCTKINSIFFSDLNENCKSDTDCSVIDNAQCSKNHKCECKPGFFNLGNQCQRLIGTDCSDDSNCMIGNSTCNPQVRTCQCHGGYYSSKNGTECRPYAKGNFCLHCVGNKILNR